MFRTPHSAQIHLNHLSASPFARWHPNPQRTNLWLFSLRSASFAKKSKDYYSILGVSKDASERDVRCAYLKLVKQWHPDLHPKEPAKTRARQKFIAIREAYEVLHPGIPRRRRPNPESRSQSNARGRGPYERPRHKRHQEWARTRQRKQRPKSNPLSNSEILIMIIAVALVIWLYSTLYWLIGGTNEESSSSKSSSSKSSSKKTYLSDSKGPKLLGSSKSSTNDVLVIGPSKPRETRLLSEGNNITVDCDGGSEILVTVIMAMVALLPIVLTAVFVWRQLERKEQLELVTAESTANEVDEDEAAVESRDSKGDSSLDNQETIAPQIY